MSSEITSTSETRWPGPGPSYSVRVTTFTRRPTANSIAILPLSSIRLGGEVSDIASKTTLPQSLESRTLLPGESYVNEMMTHSCGFMFT